MNLVKFVTADLEVRPAKQKGWKWKTFGKIVSLLYSSLIIAFLTAIRNIFPYKGLIKLKIFPVRERFSPRV